MFLTKNVPSPLEKATGKEFHPAPPISAMSAFPSPLKSPTSLTTPGCAAQLAKLSNGLLVTRKVPSPLEKATGRVLHPAPPISAMSAFPSPLKSPTSLTTPGCAAQLAKLSNGLLVTRKVPSPLEKATGRVFHQEAPISAMSAFPSPLKSPTSLTTPGCAAQLAKLSNGLSVTRKVPSPLEKAIGRVFHQEAPVSAMSALPSPLKSPTSLTTPGCAAQLAKLSNGLSVTRKVPSPLEKAIGRVFHQEAPVSAMSALPSPLKSPTSLTTPGSDAQLAKLSRRELVT